MQEHPPQKPTLRQRIVGLFVAWQLLFLVAANLLAFLPMAEADDGELTDSRSTPDTAQPNAYPAALNAANKALTIWAQGTGQVQAWWLFAPSFPTQATFPVVHLHWSSGEASDVAIPSRQEPQDPSFYIRLPGSEDRFFHYEVRLGLIATGLTATSVAEHPKEWRDAFEERVRRQWKSMRAYMRWRTEEYRRQHPGLSQPNQVELSMRIYETPAPGTVPPEWSAPMEQSLARWFPALDEQSEYLPVEFYDPVRKCFTRLKVKE